jgi:hypothetical protein
MIDEKVANKLGLIVKNHRTNIKWVSANGNDMVIVGQSKVFFQIGKKRMMHKFLITRNLIHNVILGWDFMVNNKVVLNTRDKTVTINKIKYPLNRAANHSVNIVNNNFKPSELVKINDKLNEDQTIRLKSLIDEYRDVFAASEFDLGQANFYHEIKMTDPTPIKQRPYRIPYAKQKRVEQHVNEMLKHNIIRKSQSPFASPIVLTEKPDGSDRFCIDYRKLNEKTVKDSYPMPLIEDKLDRLGKSRYFSSLDLASGYWQIKMHPNSIEKTAFATHMGLYELLVMGFGLCNAGATFQRAMETILEGLRHSLVYIDDVLTHSNDFDSHIANLRETFNRLRKAKLKLKPSKCSFGFQTIKFLGYVISDKGVKIDESRTEVISNYPKPKNARQVKQFLGLASYYRKFIQNFADVAKPLNELTRQDTQFKWSSECEMAFEELKRRLASPPILKFPDFDRPFTITTDASNIGLGAILSQIYNNNEHVVAYASRNLNSAEKNYSTIEKELLAIVWAIDKFEPYVLGTKFTVVTDHSPLVHLKNLKIKSRRLTKWRLKLAEYNFEVIHKKGKQNTNADCLSRLAHESSKLSVETIKRIDIGFEQLRDPPLKTLYNSLKTRRIKNYRLIDNIIYKQQGHNLKLVVPQSLKRRTMQICHDEMAGGHLGLNKTYKKVQERFYWKNMWANVKQLINSCAKCASRKNPKPTRARLHPITSPTKPFDILGVDILGPLPTTEGGMKYIVVFTDYLTKWVEAFAIPNMEASTIANIFVNEIIARHSAPVALLSDQGKNFLSNLIQEVCNYFNTKKINTTAYHPQTNGLTERFNRTLCEMLSHYTSEHQRDWDIFLPIVLFAYRASSQATTLKSPFELLYNRLPNLPSDLDLQRIKTDLRILRKITEVWNTAKRRIYQAGVQETNRLNQKYNSISYKVGDRVRLHSPATKIGLKTKLRNDIWHGPYDIINVYDNGNVDLLINNKIKRVHINRIKPAEVQRNVPFLS